MYLACETERPGKSCVFWTKDKKYPNGVCTFNNGRCLQIVEQCVGCKYIEKTDTGEWCLVYMTPHIHWTVEGMRCPMYVNPEEIKKQAEEERKTNPLKASRRKSKGRAVV